jgi:hypothetical protein
MLHKQKGLIPFSGNGIKRNRLVPEGGPSDTAVMRAAFSILINDLLS